MGPFFAVELHHDEIPTPPWHRLSELVNVAGRLEQRVEAVRVALAPDGRPEGIEPRVAASTTHLGLAARLLAPALAAAVMGYPPFDLRLDQVWWQHQLGGPYPISVAIGQTAEQSPLSTGISTVTAAFVDRYALSTRVLWGNVASAVNSSANIIVQQRPDLAERAHDIATAFMADPRLASEPATIGPGFRRASCCLLYRVADATPRAICGDCVLHQTA